MNGEDDTCNSKSQKSVIYWPKECRNLPSYDSPWGLCVCCSGHPSALVLSSLTRTCTALHCSPYYSTDPPKHFPFVTHTTFLLSLHLLKYRPITSYFSPCSCWFTLGSFADLFLLVWLTLTLKMEAIHSFEMSVNCWNIWYHITHDSTVHNHCCEQNTVNPVQNNITGLRQFSVLHTFPFH